MGRESSKSNSTRSFSRAVKSISCFCMLGLLIVFASNCRDENRRERVVLKVDFAPGVLAHTHTHSRKDNYPKVLDRLTFLQSCKIHFFGIN